MPAGLQRGQRVVLVEGAPSCWSERIGLIPRKGVEVAIQDRVDLVKLITESGGVEEVPIKFVKLLEGGRQQRKNLLA